MKIPRKLLTLLDNEEFKGTDSSIETSLLECGILYSEKHSMILYRMSANKNFEYTEYSVTSFTKDDLIKSIKNIPAKSFKDFDTNKVTFLKSNESLVSKIENLLLIDSDSINVSHDAYNYNDLYDLLKRTVADWNYELKNFII